jgi:DNA topoisomerase-1
VARKGGWTRAGSRRHFRYLDRRGRRITDAAKLERIQALAIPPAWKDVWISSRARAKLLATGLDAAGRRQYLYHEDYRAAQEEAKFGKLVRFADALPVLREAMSERMDLDPMSPEWTCALAVGLINLRWFRVGDDRYTKAHRTFGITTLRKSHVKVRGSRIAFRFRAKHRIWVRTAVVDSELAEAIRELLDTPGQRLFRYRLEARNSRRRISGRGAAR